MKESRMNFADARKLDRESGVRLGECAAPVDCLRGCYDTGSFGTKRDGAFGGGFLLFAPSSPVWKQRGYRRERSGRDGPRLC
jgi:hypothetical protein